MTEKSGTDGRADPYVLPAWQSGPVLHRHTSVDGALYVLSGASRAAVA